MTDLSSPELELDLELDLEAVYGWRTSSKAFVTNVIKEAANGQAPGDRT